MRSLPTLTTCGHEERKGVHSPTCREGPDAVHFLMGWLLSTAPELEQVVVEWGGGDQVGGHRDALF